MSPQSNINPTWIEIDYTSWGIPLRDGSYAIVDKADELLLSGFNWKLFANGYVAANRGKTTIYIHRLLVGPAPDELVDHADMNPLNNRTSNLRVATKSQNAANRIDRGADRRRVRGASQYKGVSWRKDRELWIVSLHFMGKTKRLGDFEYENDAARVWNTKALETWGEFARLNVVPEGRGRRYAGDAQ